MATSPMEILERPKTFRGEKSSDLREVGAGEEKLLYFSNAGMLADNWWRPHSGERLRM